MGHDPFSRKIVKCINQVYLLDKFLSEWDRVSFTRGNAKCIGQPIHSTVHWENEYGLYTEESI